MILCPTILDNKTYLSRKWIFDDKNVFIEYKLSTTLIQPPKPVLSDFYVPSEDHHNRELVFITLSMVGTGAFLWYSDQ